MTFILQPLIWLKNTVIRPYYYLRMWKPFWKMLNREPRALFAAAHAPLGEVQGRVSAALKAEGIAITHLEELFPGQDLLTVLQERAADLETVATPNAKKTFLTQLIQLYPEIDVRDVFVRFALSNEVLGCVSHYLEMWPTLYYYTLGITRPVEQEMAPRQSQRWHRDPEDRKMCKVFIYLTDVDETCGPLMYVRGSAQAQRWAKLFAQRPPLGHYPPEGAVERSVASDDLRVCTGRAGTVIFADTSGLHKGGYATGGRRMMSTTGFVTKACTKGVFYTHGSDFQEQRKECSPMAQYALENAKIANRN